MVSAMVSRATGMGMIITEQQLLEINKRRLGTKYKDEEEMEGQLGSTEDKQECTLPRRRHREYMRNLRRLPQKIPRGVPADSQGDSAGNTLGELS